jgi:hypothetical protein
VDSSLYFSRYTVIGNGSVNLPAHVRWRVLPRYVGRSKAGNVVDERITLVLEDRPDDGPNGFWPVIVKLSVEEAERLHAALGDMIAERSWLDGDGR